MSRLDENIKSFNGDQGQLDKAKFFIDQIALEARSDKLGNFLKWLNQQLPPQ